MDPREQLERIVSAALGTTIRRCRRPTVGSVAETSLLDLEEGPHRAVCKLGGASVWTGDVIEPFVLQALEETTELPVPEVLASGSIRPEPVSDPGRRLRDRSDPLSRWALYEFRAGQNPNPWYQRCDRSVRRRIVADAGTILGRLHSAVQFDRIGGFERCDERNGSGRRCNDGASDGHEQVGHSLGLSTPDPCHAMGALETFQSSCPDSRVDLLPAAIPRVDDTEAVLCHGDFHPGNLLVTETGAITTVLDWGNAHVAPAEYAVARAEARFVDRFQFRRAERDRLRKRFRQTYAEHAPLEPEYRRRAPLYKALWLAQSVANVAHIARSSRGRKQLERQLRSLGSTTPR